MKTIINNKNMNNVTNTFQRWLKMSGIAVAVEKQQRSLAKELGCVYTFVFLQ